jgi:hypothetical protein
MFVNARARVSIMIPRRTHSRREQYIQANSVVEQVNRCSECHSGSPSWWWVHQRSGAAAITRTESPTDRVGEGRLYICRRFAPSVSSKDASCGVGERSCGLQTQPPEREGISCFCTSFSLTGSAKLSHLQVCTSWSQSVSLVRRVEPKASI